MYNPLISLLLTTHNSEAFIFDTIAQIKNQTCKDFELVIVDDCSSDNTFNLLYDLTSSISNTKIIRNSKNLGVSESRLTALNSSKAPFVSFIDHDDKISISFIELFLSVVNSNSKIALITGSYMLIDREDDINSVMKETSNQYSIVSIDEFIGQLKPGYFITPIWAKVYRRDIFDYKIIDYLKSFSNLLFLEDISLLFYLINLNDPVATIDQVVYFHISHDPNEPRVMKYGDYFIQQIFLGAEILKFYDAHNLSKLYDGFLIGYSSLCVGIYSYYSLKKTDKLDKRLLKKVMRGNSISLIKRLELITPRLYFIVFVGFAPNISLPILKLYRFLKLF